MNSDQTASAASPSFGHSIKVLVNCIAVTGVPISLILGFIALLCGTSQGQSLLQIISAETPSWRSLGHGAWALLAMILWSIQLFFWSDIRLAKHQRELESETQGAIASIDAHPSKLDDSPETTVPARWVFNHLPAALCSAPYFIIGLGILSFGELRPSGFLIFGLMVVAGGFVYQIALKEAKSQTYLKPRSFVSEATRGGQTRRGNLLFTFINFTLPRLFGLVAIGTFASSEQNPRIWLAGILAVITLWLVTYWVRRKDQIAERLDREAMKVTEDDQELTKLLGVHQRFATLAWLQITVLAMFPVLLVGFIPVWFGQTVGALAVVVLFFSGVLPLLAIGALYARQNGFSFLLVLPFMLICLAIVATVVRAFDFSPQLPRYQVTAYSAKDASETALNYKNRDTIEEFAARWIQNQQDKKPDQTEIPVVFVASSGGGQKAAFWTAQVLGSAHDQIDGFSDSIAGISSVSGGSLGSVVFAALLSTDAKDVTLLSRSVIDQDGIGPVFAALLFSDFPSNFLHIPYLGRPDRGQTLEIVWERGWKNCSNGQCLRPAPSHEISVQDRHSKQCSTEALFKQNFLCLWSLDVPETWVPALLVNGTIQESGKRIIVSNVRTPESWDAFDFYEYADFEIKASTAITNSARFPFVSPAGKIKRSGEAFRGHIIDGGYVDNSGSMTLRDFVDTFMEQLVVQSDQLEDTRVFIPVILEIENGQSEYCHGEYCETISKARSNAEICENKEVCAPCNGSTKCREPWFPFLSQISSPFQGLGNARRANQQPEIVRFHWLTEAISGDVNPFGIDLSQFSGQKVAPPLYLQFSLCEPDRGQNPLGWTHSKKAIEVYPESLPTTPIIEAEERSLDRRSACQLRNQLSFLKLKGLFETE